MIAEKDIDEGLRLAIERAGSIRALARALGVAHVTVMKWRQIPAERLLQAEAITGIAREKLRPDIFRKR